MSVNYGPDDWRDRGFSSREEYEQWLEDEEQAQRLAEWAERRRKGDPGCWLIAMLILLAVIMGVML